MGGRAKLSVYYIQDSRTTATAKYRDWQHAKDVHRIHVLHRDMEMLGGGRWILCSMWLGRRPLPEH